MADTGGWYDCWVSQAGPAHDGKIYIRMKEVNSKFPFQWFYAIESMKKEMLAVALAAIQLKAPVRAGLQATSEYSQINNLYIIGRAED